MSEPTAGWFEAREHRLPVRVYYEDTDATCLVYHANYVRYLERGRSDFLRMAGISHTDLREQEDATAFVVTRIEVDYRRPARLDDALLVRTVYEVVRGPRLSIRQSITRGDEVLVEAAVEAACITLDGRARRPPPGLHDKLRPYLAPSS
ncbi:MAG TPA: tol-pal system-associated acyl-CoA thioesterase [Caulobacteraceae bacterium]|jgi:acyl-CoA thioester hydrolase